MFGLSCGVKVGGYEKRNDRILTLSSTDLLSMHKKETLCFQPDRPCSSGEGEGLRQGPGLAGWAAESRRGQSFQSRQQGRTHTCRQPRVCAGPRCPHGGPRTDRT